MKIIEKPCLRAFNTFGTTASAALLYHVESEEDLLSLPGFNPARDLVLGAGSNVLLTTDVPGAVFLNRIAGIQRVAQSGDSVWVEAGAGVCWHDLVRWSLQQGLCGLENLSLIPGLVGAAPIQNIGAYGVELQSVLDRVTAWDWRLQTWASLDAADCRLAYRDSLFKSIAPDRYFITSVRLKLNRVFVPQLAYAGLREELAGAGIDDQTATATDVSEAVVRIRQHKLPDPAVHGNAGSFFKNPVLEHTAFEALKLRHSDLPGRPAADDTVKLSAAWLIEQCGFKGSRDGDAGVSARHALVLVNHGAARGADIAALARRIQTAVNERFGIWLAPEPRIVEFTG